MLFPTFLSNASDNLYHIKRTIIDPSQDLTNSARTVDILGSYTDLPSAKYAARTALLSEGYLADDFEVYQENNGKEDWKYGEGVRVYAKTFAGQTFEVRIDTKPNVGRFEGKEGCGRLFYGSSPWTKLLSVTGVTEADVYHST